MTTAYFDGIVFDQINKGRGFTPADLELIRGQALDPRQLRDCGRWPVFVLGL